MIAGMVVYIRSSNRHPFPAIAMVAFILTFYHFNAQYASRVMFFITLFLAAYAIRWLISSKLNLKIAYAMVLAWALFGVVDLSARNIRFYQPRMKEYAGYGLLAERMNPALEKHLMPGSYVLADAGIYLNNIMPFVPVHGLVAYHSGEYFQLDPEISLEMRADYDKLMQSTDIRTIDSLCQKYGIRTAVLRYGQMEYPVFKTIRARWQILEDNEFFKIYLRPS